MTERPMLVGIVVSMQRHTGPKLDVEEAVEVLIDELPDELWVDDTGFALVYEVAPLAAPEGTRRVDV